MNINSLLSWSLVFLGACLVANSFGAHVDIDTVKQVVLAVLAKYGLDSAFNSNKGENPK